MADSSSSLVVADFIRAATTQWQTAEAADTENRTEAEIDQQFRNLRQWDSEDERRRKTEKRPCLTIDQINEPIRQLTNRQRNARYSLKVHPVGNGADEDTAEDYQGIIRHLEVNGGAKAARDWAFQDAASIGWGYYRLNLEYENPLVSRDQIITYEAIRNPFSVYDDPARIETRNQVKRRFLFIVEDLPKDEYRRRFPHSQIAGLETFHGIGNAQPEWFPEGGVRIAEYFFVDEQDVKMCELPDGQVVKKADAPAGVPPVAAWTATSRTVKWALINAVEILEGNEDKTGPRDWAGTYIPVFEVVGEELNINGKRVRRGIVRPMRGPQVMYNFHASELVGELALTPKAKIMMPVGGEEGLEREYEESNRRNLPYLRYNSSVVTSDGRIMETKPFIAQFTDPAKIQAIVMALNQAKVDIHTTGAYYDQTDPNRKNAEQSGRAMDRRKEAQELSSNNYIDNFMQHTLVQQETPALLDLIPKIYYRPGRILRILGKEDKARAVILKQPFVDGKKGPEPLTPGDPRHGTELAHFYDPGVGTYDMTVTVGMSYATQRQETASQQIDLMKVLPDMMRAAIAPLAVRNMDIIGNDDMADRMDRTLPPEIRGDENEQGPDPAMLQQQIKQASAVIQVVTKELNSKNDLIEKDTLKIDSDERIKRAEIEAKIQIAAMDNDTKLRIEELKLRGELMQAELDAKQAELTQFYAQRHERGMADVSHGQALETADMSHQQALEQQAVQPVDGASA